MNGFIKMQTTYPSIPPCNVFSSMIVGRFREATIIIINLRTFFYYAIKTPVSINYHSQISYVSANSFQSLEYRNQYWQQ